MCVKLVSGRVTGRSLTLIIGTNSGGWAQGCTSLRQAALDRDQDTIVEAMDIVQVFKSCCGNLVPVRAGNACQTHDATNSAGASMAVIVHTTVNGSSDVMHPGLNIVYALTCRACHP